MTDDWELEESLEAWRLRSLADMVEHVLRRYHYPLDARLLELNELAHRVEVAHETDEDAERFSDILETTLAFEADLRRHLILEEQILFPMITSGEGERAVPDVESRRVEHDEGKRLLARLRALTGGFVAGPDADRNVESLWRRLAELEAMTLAHMRFEDEVLFPAVVGLRAT